jgi:hypothetical protein
MKVAVMHRPRAAHRPTRAGAWGGLLLAALAPLGCAETQEKEPATPAEMALPVLAAAPAHEDDGEPRAPARPLDTRGCEPRGKSITVVHRDQDGHADRWRYFQSVRRAHRTFHVLTCELADNNHDGKVDARYFYGARGRLVLEQRDLDFDGRAEFVADYSQFSSLSPARATLPRHL